MTVRDYIASSEVPVHNIHAKYLEKYEEILQQQGKGWLTVTPDDWETLFQLGEERNVSAITRVDTALSNFYGWLAREGYCEYNAHYIPLRYSTDILASVVRHCYPSSLETVIEQAQHVQAKTKGTTVYARTVNLALIILMWGGLLTKDCASLLAKNVVFYDADGRSFIPDSSSQIASVSIEMPTFSSRFHSAKIVAILYDVWEVAQKSPNPKSATFLQGDHGEPLSAITLNRRFNNLVHNISDMFQADYSAETLRKAAAYEEAYLYWKYARLPWIFSLSHIDKLYEFLPTQSKPTNFEIQRNEFLVFTLYAKYVKHDPSVP